LHLKTEEPDLCPVGKKAGTAWYGCCPFGGGPAKLIAFLDCCGTGFCVRPTKRCKNWPDAKDWYFFNDRAEKTGERSYYCTGVIEMISDASCA